MSSLIKKEGMAGSVQMVFFDPPYGISFKSNLQTNTKNRNIKEKKDSIPNDALTISSFRDTYKNGLNSYFDNLYKNLILVHEILEESGSVFVQIGETNVHRVAIILDEIFGSSNRISTITFAKTGSSASEYLANVNNYLLWYSKDKFSLSEKYIHLYEIPESKNVLDNKLLIELEDGSCRRLSNDEKNGVRKLPQNSKLFAAMPLTSQDEQKNRSEDYYCNKLNKTFKCTVDRHWSVSYEDLDKLAEMNRLYAPPKGSGVYWKRYETENPGTKISNLWHKVMKPTDLHYIVETAEDVVERCILMSTNPGDIVLDITCGSGTTAYCSEKWGRRWITTDTNGVAVSLTRQRLISGIYDYYVLNDSEEGYKINNKKLSEFENITNDISKDFVYEQYTKISPDILLKEKQSPINLVNRPIKSKSKTIRVSSPFTIESESPLMYISPIEDLDDSVIYEKNKSIVESLQTTGINNLKDNSKTILEEIEDYPIKGGITHRAYLNYDDSKSEEVFISIVPDDLTVSSSYIKNVIKGMKEHKNVKKLIIIAFEFEATTRSKNNEIIGNVQIIKVQINRDLMIGNLKDSESDKAFVMIGEPDVKVNKVGKNKITLEVLGFDTYNPVSGNVESIDKDTGHINQIDCWMIDTDYNGKSFFARHIHFPSKQNDKQILDMLKTLKINYESKAYKNLFSTISAEIDIPKSKKIAVRIVTTTHTEMTTVIDLNE